MRNNPIHQCQYCRRERGFSLVEVLVAMAVSSILFLGVFQLLDDTQRSSQAGRVVSQMNDDTRYIFDALGRNIRMSGFNFDYAGFSGLSSLGASDDFLSGSLPIEGYLGSNPPSTNLGSLPGLVATEDILVIRSMSSGYFRLAADLTSSETSPIYGAFESSGGGAVVETGILAQDPSLIDSTRLGGGSDLEILEETDSFGVFFNVQAASTEPFQISNPAITTGLTSGFCGMGAIGTIQPTCNSIAAIVRASSSSAQSAGTQIHAANYRLYYICEYDNDRVCGGTPVVGQGLVLYSGNSNIPPQVLVENVEGMRFAFAPEDTNGNILDYAATGDSSLSGATVRSVRSVLFLRGTNYFANALAPVDFQPSIVQDFVATSDISGDGVFSDLLTVTESRDLIRRFEFSSHRRQ